MNVQTQPGIAHNLHYRIFALISRLNMEATPVNFELFHEIVSGNNPELRERFAKLGKKVRPQDVEALAREYLPHHFGDSIFEHSADVMRGDLQELLGSIKESQAQLSNYSKDLGASSERMKKIDPADTASIRKELASIAALTDLQQTKSETILGTLGGKLSSVNQLSSEIDSVQHQKFTHVTTGLGNRRAFNKHMAELYAGDKGPGDCVLILAKIRNFDALERPELIKLKEFVLERLGKSVKDIMGEGDFGAWTDNPHLSVVIGVTQDSEIQRLTAVVGEQFMAAFKSVHRSAPHLPAMTISFGAATTYAASNAASMIAGAEKALAEALNSAAPKTIIFGANKTDAEGANYQLYGRSVTV
jgi:diguanylate cyclase